VAEDENDVGNRESPEDEHGEREGMKAQGGDADDAEADDAKPAAGTAEGGPTRDELRAALDRVGVSDVLVEALMATVSLGFRRVSAEARDLPQARLAIESLRAL